MPKTKKGFTLIELLVTIMIIGILVTLVTFGVRQAQESARNSKRQSDLETIAAGLELYRAECNRYPPSDSFLSGTLSGGGTPPNCTGSYITAVPKDPQPTARKYGYSVNATGSSYSLCASLEGETGSVSECGGGCTETCNYKISRP